MKIEFYGKIASAFNGAADMPLPPEGLSVSLLRDRLAEEYDIDEVRHRFIRAVVNDEFVRDDHLVRPGDAVAFLSPVSGG